MAPQDLRALEQRLTASVREAPGDFGIAAMDLDTGAVVGVNQNTPYPMASVVKIAVAATYLSQVDRGMRRMDDQIGGVSATSLMDRMLTRSDNRATDQLIAALGGPQVVHQWIRAQGLTGIRVDRNIADLLAARRDLWDVRDSSTPTAMLQLLRIIDRGNALTPRSRAILLDMMGRCVTGSNRIRGLLPPGTRIEHKTGTLTGYTGDAALVTLPSGRRIAIVTFARGGTNRPAVIASASRTIYDAFVGNSPIGTPPTFAGAQRYMGGGVPQRPAATLATSRLVLPPDEPTGDEDEGETAPVRGGWMPGDARPAATGRMAGPGFMLPHPGQPIVRGEAPQRMRPDR